MRSSYGDLLGLLLLLLYVLPFAEGQNVPLLISPTSDALTLTYSQFSTAGGEDDILLYEISQRNIFSSNWDVISNLGEQSEAVLESQIISVRVDSVSVLNSGSFQLGVDWSQRSYGRGEITDRITTTENIAWDADSETVKGILQDLSNVVIRSVVRCDDAADNAGPGGAGYNSLESGILNCPYSNRGGFKWLVTFESSGATGVPSLHVAHNDLGGGWTGAGPQVTVTHLSRGRVNPSICVNGVCKYVVTNLKQSTPYSFKIRALTLSYGWSEYTPASEFTMTLEERAPSRPRPPILSSLTNMSAIFKVTQPPEVQGVSFIESQYRRVDVLTAWAAGAVRNLDVNRFRRNLLLDITLPSAGEYEARVRMLNRIGYSPYSGSSEVFSIVNITAVTAASTSTVTVAADSSTTTTAASNSSLNSLTGSNSSFTKITSMYPKEVQNTEFIGPSATGAAIGAVPARIYDFYYRAGVGVGGTHGTSGGSGFCEGIAFDPRLQQPFSLKSFAYTGKEVDFIVPTADPVIGIISQITFRCWGAGGGGGGTASYGNLTAPNITSYTHGGGGAFAQATIVVKQGDILTIRVAGGGTASNGQLGGKGGFGGGGDGGRGFEGATGGGHGGGGGGGSSSVSRAGVVLVNAAGGAGAGSSHDCCADGGGAGGALGTPGGVPTLGFNDVSLATVGKGYPDGDARRQLYVVESYSQAGSTAAIGALSATGGAGGGTSGGTGGASGSYAISKTGAVSVAESGSAAVFDQGGGYVTQAMPGKSDAGGAGASGLQGGGGGGGGYFGGGGGGSGVNAAGGGGGSSYANPSASPTTTSSANCTIIVDYYNNTCAHVTVNLPVTTTTVGVTRFSLELTEGYTAQDFNHVANILPNEITAGSSNTQGVHLVCGLTPLTPYSIRAIPYVSTGRGFKSNRATFTTLSNPFNNYWEPIVPRRLSLAGIGRGFTDAVIDFPNLDAGAEVYTQGVTQPNRPAPDNPDNIVRYADPGTAKQPAYPSARKGHSLNTFRGKVYMFGGRSNGYSCAYGYTDMLNFGSVDSGRVIYPCNHFQPEVQDLWTLDVITYEWSLISVTNYTTVNNVTLVAYNMTPPAREQHTTAIVGNYLYLFGGKTDIYISANATSDELHPLDNYFYNDLWRMELPHPQAFGLNYSAASESFSVLTASGQYIMPIPQDKLLYLTINGSAGGNIQTEGTGQSPREGKCIDSIVVHLSIYHPCINQLKIYLTGPGDLTGSANYQPSSSDHEVILFDMPSTNGTGCSSGLHSFVFEDSSTRLTYTCCTSVFSGVYQPNGKINEFLGYSTSTDWVLSVQDAVDDLNTGYVVSWGIDFTVSDCVFDYTWVNVTAASPPSPRYHASSLVFGSSIFFFGGRDSYDSPTHDLYRFDTLSSTWTQLTPMNFGDTLLEASAVGCSLVLTPYGLLRFGGYPRLTALSSNNEHYVRNVYLLDPSTMRWQELFISDWGLYDGSVNTAQPAGRYLSAMTYISRRQISFQNIASSIDTTTSHYRALFDTYSNSTHTNYVGDIADSVFVYGGFNGATGSTYGGSDTGLLSDSWMLRLSNFSTNASTAATQLYLQNSCAWRFSSATKIPFTVPKAVTPCLGGSKSPCSFRDMLLLSWCSANYQTV